MRRNVLHKSSLEITLRKLALLCINDKLVDHFKVGLIAHFLLSVFLVNL